jgi:hypothetical protein
MRQARRLPSELRENRWLDHAVLGPLNRWAINEITAKISRM